MANAAAFAIVRNQPVALSPVECTGARKSCCATTTINQHQIFQCIRATRMATSITDSSLETTKDVSGQSPLRLTYLEGNSWLWELGGLRILVDPVLVGNLDFGVPWLYNGAKKLLKKFKLEDIGKIDLLLITQSLDDHCHSRTLVPFSRMFPEVTVVATPNAKTMLRDLFTKVIYLQPGKSTTISSVKVTASAGPVLGPPWQKPENGYFVESIEPKISLYFEPHCVYDRASFGNKTADVLITPVIKQRLPFLTLVSGQEDAVELAKALQPKYIVTMNNGDLDATGILSKLLMQVGTTQSFKSEVAKVLPQVRVLDPEPGKPLEVAD